jgi:predicted AlkP superfamily phosphohydrolase/phosphomutase/tetratricopeptide (TPR) repeat protein
MGERVAKKLLLIGWDAADWKLINPLLDQGHMPALEHMINHGVMGNLATLRPILSPMLWNSIATGKRPDKHGILGFIEPDPDSGKLRPVSSTSRKVKALWNICMQSGLRSHVLGWFAGHPAEPVNGISVSPLFAESMAPLDQPWPVPSNSIHPVALAETLAVFRVHPGHLSAEEILPFVPRAAEVDQEKDNHLGALAKILAENCSLHNAATWILANEPWDFLAVYYNGIDHFCHAFMNFHPPRMESVPEKQFEIYKDVVNGAYKFHDMMLERLLQLAGPDTTVVLLSDHGFHSDHLRPRYMPKTGPGPATGHRPIGVICMAGPHLRQDERIYGANLLDITPTVLTLLGLPIGEDMDGRVLVEAFEEPPSIEKIPSWEDVPGECGMHPANLRMDPAAAQAMMQQFVALGYIQAPTEDQARAVQNCVRESQFNLAQVYLDSYCPAEALPILEQLTTEMPEEIRFALHLGQCYLDLARLPEARTILEGLVKRGGQPWADWLLGLVYFEENSLDDALFHLSRAAEAEPRLPDLHVRLGATYLRMRRLDEAEQAFQKAVSIDADSPEAHLGLARLRLRRRQNREAAEEALAAVSLRHFLPLGHYCLGVALGRLNHLERAEMAFRTALSMAPGLVNAHRWLGAIYRRNGGDFALIAEHQRAIAELQQKRRLAGAV